MRPGEFLDSFPVDDKLKPLKTKVKHEEKTKKLKLTIENPNDVGFYVCTYFCAIVGGHRSLMDLTVETLGGEAKVKKRCYDKPRYTDVIRDFKNKDYDFLFIKAKSVYEKIVDLETRFTFSGTMKMNISWKKSSFTFTTDLKKKGDERKFKRVLIESEEIPVLVEF